MLILRSYNVYLTQSNSHRSSNKQNVRSILCQAIETVLRQAQKPLSWKMAVGYFSLYWLLGQVLNFAAYPNKITFHCFQPFITRPRTEVQAAPTNAPQTNSIQILPTTPVIPIRDPRPEALGPWTTDQTTWTLPQGRVQGSGKVASKVLTVDLQRRVSNLLIKLDSVTGWRPSAASFPMPCVSSSHPEQYH